MTMATPLTPSQEALKKVEDQLDCAICLQPYTDPKELPCSHVYCKQCLESLVTQDHDGLKVTCPKCRQSIPLPPGGVAELRSPYFVHHLFDIRDTLKKPMSTTQCQNCKKTAASRFCQECGKYLCTKCTIVHQMWDDFASHQVTTIEPATVTTLVPQKVEGCSKHQGNELKFYCDTCQELICSSCTVQLHQDHLHGLVTETFPKHRDEILSQLQPVREIIDKITKALWVLDARAKEVTDQRGKVETDIEKQFKQLQQALEQRKGKLIGDLDQLAQEKLASIVAKRQEFEQLQTQFNNCLEYAEGSLKTANERQVLAMKAPVIEHIQETMAQFNPDTLAPEQGADVLLIAENMADLTEACRTFAEITEPVDPSKCYTTGDGLKTATDGIEASVTLHAVNKHGKESQQPVDATAKLVCCNNGTIVNCNVKQGRKGSEYEIRYQPVTRGKHQLHITIGGKQTKGSPHGIAVKPHCQSLGNVITTIEQLNTPYGIVADSKSRVIVTENGAHKVSIFSSDGALLQSFGTEGAEREQFNRPCGVTVDNEDNIYVVDSSNHRIQKFNPDGQFVRAIGSKGYRSPLLFNSPAGIGYNSINDKLYVCDRGNFRIQVLDTHLTYISTFGNRGTRNGQFNSPTDIAFDEAGHVHVVDNTYVHIFTPEGQFLARYGCSPLRALCGITIDPGSAYVYTTCQNNHRVYMFTTQGQYIHEFGSNYAQAISVDENGFIMVTNTCGVINIF